MLSDPIINWKDVLKGKGLSKADLAAMPVGSSGLTKKELRKTLNALSANQAQLVSLLPQAAIEEFGRCIIAYERETLEDPFAIAEDCLAYALGNTI